MFEVLIDKIKSFFSSVWKKAAVSVAGGVVSYLVLRYAVPGLLSLNVVSLAGACAGAYLVWTQANWIRRVAAKVGIDLGL